MFIELADTPDDCLQISYTQRVIAFAFCVVLGFISGVFAIISISLLNLRKFIILYTFCNILVFCSPMLLVGVAKQCKSMFSRKRLMSTVACLTGILITVFFAMVKRRTIGVVCGFIIEFAGFVSYIPYGDKIISWLLSRN